jgi:hypothetical protein
MCQESFHGLSFEAKVLGIEIKPRCCCNIVQQIEVYRWVGNVREGESIY